MCLISDLHSRAYQVQLWNNWAVCWLDLNTWECWHNSPYWLIILQVGHSSPVAWLSIQRFYGRWIKLVYTTIVLFPVDYTVYNMWLVTKYPFNISTMYQLMWFIILKINNLSNDNTNLRHIRALRFPYSCHADPILQSCHAYPLLLAAGKLR